MKVGMLYGQIVIGDIGYYPPPPPPPLISNTHTHHPFFSSEQLLELHRGQGKDIYWRDSFICPTEEEYMEMVRQSKLSTHSLSLSLSLSALIHCQSCICCYRNWRSIRPCCGPNAAIQ